MSKRDIDMHAERELADFLDTHFYQELLKEGGFLSFKRISNIEMQKAGVDVIGKTAQSDAYIDEKAQLHYVKRPLPTFAFELSFLSRGSEITGWFLNDKLKTTHYFLLWPKAKISDLARIKSTDFVEVEGLIIRKTALKDYLFSLGFDDLTLRNKTRELRKTGIPGSHSTNHKGITYHLSPASDYDENPINIVIRKERLLSIEGSVHYRITPNGFNRIKTLR